MENIFIYGLFRDQARTLLGCLKSHGTHFVQGKIYKVNEFYPGFKPGSGRVIGELIGVESSVLPQLDEYEGFEYDRVKIVTESGINCWIYQYKGDVSNFLEIKAGDWMLR